MVALNGQGKTRGSAAILTEEMTCNQSLAAILPSPAHEPLFMLYFIESQYKELRALTGDNARNGLNLGLLKKFPISLPPLPEQERIAEVLTSVDDSIRATEAVIAQAERVKRGLMEDLLTGGLGSEAIARGEVPEGWQVKPISDWQIDLVDGDRGKEYPKSNEFLDEGFCLFLNAKNVTKTGWQFDERKFISEERHLKLRKGTLERGDIVITTRGTIGNIAYYDDRVPFDVCRINSGMAIFRNCDPNILTPFLKVQLEAVPIQRQIETLTYGSAQPALTIKTLKSLSLPVPEENEQERIIAALATADENLTTNQLILSQLQTVKRGLMDDLLTGRVRTV
jgi:type I restriction enzyme S subunit